MGMPTFSLGRLTTLEETGYRAFTMSPEWWSPQYIWRKMWFYISSFVPPEEHSFFSFEKRTYWTGIQRSRTDCWWSNGFLWWGLASKSGACCLLNEPSLPARPLSLILSKVKSNQWSEQPNLFVWSFASPNSKKQEIDLLLLTIVIV